MRQHCDWWDLATLPVRSLDTKTKIWGLKKMALFILCLLTSFVSHNFYFRIDPHPHPYHSPYNTFFQPNSKRFFIITNKGPPPSPHWIHRSNHNFLEGSFIYMLHYMLIVPLMFNQSCIHRINKEYFWKYTVVSC